MLLNLFLLLTAFRKEYIDLFVMNVNGKVNKALAQIVDVQGKHGIPLAFLEAPERMRFIFGTKPGELPNSIWVNPLDV